MDPIIWKNPGLQAAAVSVASTTVTLYSPFKASYADLSGLVEPEPLLLPVGALENIDSNQVEEANVGGGSRHGKFVSRCLSRELSVDDDSEVESDRADLYNRLLEEADRAATKTGCHVKVRKLTMSKTSPYKILLRHAQD
jgi:hypothetical protein